MEDENRAWFGRFAVEGAYDVNVGRKVDILVYFVANRRAGVVVVGREGDVVRHANGYKYSIAGDVFTWSSVCYHAVAVF